MSVLLIDGADVHPPFHVDVDMVVLTFTVVGANGKHVKGLKPEDLSIREDGVRQKIVAFAEGTGSTGLWAGHQVFVLFDTSNVMYTTFPYAVDAIAGFVRNLDPADSVAVYKFSRNLFRATSVTTDRLQALAAVRNATVGEDTALYNSLLLTLRDAAKVPGPKALVVFSNGPDNASILSPDDAAAVAEDQGIPIYIVSTCDPETNKISANVFQRLVARTGGQLFWAKTWQKQAEAFNTIREDLASSYTAAYYPASNSNEGYRRITVEILTDKDKKCHIRSRTGYHARPRL